MKLTYRDSFSFFSQRSQTRRTNWRQRYLALQNAKKPFQDPEYNPDGNLKLEIDFLLEQGKREENMSEAYDLGFSLITLITFWYVTLYQPSFLWGKEK